MLTTGPRVRRPGASQCGFCTPGIIMRLPGLRPIGARRRPRRCERAILAHLCRCTGWQTIVDGDVVGTRPPHRRAADPRTTLPARASSKAAPRSASVRRGARQGGFADDRAPRRRARRPAPADGEWVVGGDAGRGPDRWPARCRAGARRRPLTWPLDVPPGDWARTLRTTWVEPAYLETGRLVVRARGRAGDPARQRRRIRRQGHHRGRRRRPPAGRPARPAVRVLSSREDVVRLGPKRPPIAAGVRADGSGVVRVARTPGIADAIRSAAPALEVVEVDVAGPATSAALRGAGWAEAAVLLASLRGGAGHGARARRSQADGVDRR